MTDIIRRLQVSANCKVWKQKVSLSEQMRQTLISIARQAEELPHAFIAQAHVFTTMPGEVVRGRDVSEMRLISLACNGSHTNVSKFQILIFQR